MSVLENTGQHTAHPDTLEMAELVARLLQLLGDDPERDGLIRTPMRVAKSLQFLTSGHSQNAHELINDALFDVEYSELVLVRDIDFYSLCEHHMLPFYGRAHVAYLPNKKVVGLSKLPRIVDMFARRLQVQERLTQDIARAIHEAVAPHGVAVVVEASHLCMMMRGVEKQNSRTVTSAMLGNFKDDPKARAEFLDLIRRP
ncbi:MAG: GTP cyclohydrolase I FolE [Nitrospirota bacterium]|nr:GTP cyclohydrolase I FolE [Nitrospirota bacterium]